MAASFAVLWDHSHLWGLLLCRGLAALGASFVPVTAAAVAGGALDSLSPRALVVPGGFARRKFAALGPAGAAAVGRYVAGGGTYFGVCGGCGLALAHEAGLGLCAWTRRPFADRLEHLVSGHVRLLGEPGSPYLPGAMPAAFEAPVWWPAGFVPPAKGGVAVDDVAVVAAYAGAGADLMLADIALGAMPGELLAACQDRFGLTLSPDFLDGGACVIAGSHGRGRYVLSHAHLETPDSPAANAWLAHLLRLFDPEASIAGTAVPAWNPAGEPTRFADVHLEAARRDLESVIAAGIEARLLMRRNDWLLGWRPGMPGFSLSNLAALLAGASALPPTPQARDYWRQVGPEFARRAAAFARRLEIFFPAQRLEITLSLVERRAGVDPGLAAERRELFGASPGGGGLCGELADSLDTLLLHLLS
jgi:hypothetical protein